MLIKVQESMTNKNLADIIILIFNNHSLTKGDRTISEQSLPSGKLYTEATMLSSLSDVNDKFSSLSTSAMLARGGVPLSHRRVADNYMIIKKVYGFPVVQSRINNKDRNLLAKYDFSQLEYSTIKQINEELSFLKKWSLSLDEDLSSDADQIIQIRANELKFLVATRYAGLTNEVYNGYLALEKYFEDISKYYQ